MSAATPSRPFARPVTPSIRAPRPRHHRPRARRARSRLRPARQGSAGADPGRGDPSRDVGLLEAVRLAARPRAARSLRDGGGVRREARLLASAHQLLEPLSEPLRVELPSAERRERPAERAGDPGRALDERLHVAGIGEVERDLDGRDARAIDALRGRSGSSASRGTERRRRARLRDRGRASRRRAGATPLADRLELAAHWRGRTDRELDAH